MNEQPRKLYRVAELQQQQQSRMSSPSRKRIRLMLLTVKQQQLLLGLLLLLLCAAPVGSFVAPSVGWVTPSSLGPQRRPTPLQQSTFTADGSEYSADNSDLDSSDDDYTEGWNTAKLNNEMMNDEDDTPTIELQPVPLSKNAGNRFVAVIWDRELQKDKSKDALDLHYDRIALTEEHVMFCRKQNLYNETFNTESMVDILWSLPILASDLRRVIGHAMCLESTRFDYVREVLSRDPIVQMLTGGDLTEIPLYRWRHIRDYSLRIDDGRDGYPCLCLALDAEPQVGSSTSSNNSNSQQLRDDVQKAYLEQLIRSERVIAAGPLHLPTEFKDDPSSLAVGDLILFNAKDRNDAIQFAENLPSAQAGLYESMRVYFYNTLDVTGKFVSEDPLRDAPCEQMKEAMEYWGYPVSDEQTPWLNG